MDNKKEQLYARYRQIVEEEAKNRSSVGIAFSQSEEKANEVFVKIRNEVQNDPSINLFRNLLKIKSVLEATRIYNVIAKMPKGILHHTHLPATMSKELFMELTHGDNVYYNRAKGVLKIGTESMNLGKEGFTRLNALRDEEGKEKVDLEVRALVTFTKESFDKRDVDVIFASFSTPFVAMGDVIYYKPNFSRLLDDVVESLIRDGFQGGELRHVFGLVVKEDYTKASLDEELDIIAKEQERIALKYPGFALSFIATSLKILDRQHFLDMAHMYARSLEKYPGLVSAYDMVHFESTRMLDEYIDDILDLQSKYKDFKVLLHAGETYSHSNNNMIIAVLLGSKRIGHGVTALRSTTKLNLLRDHDVCIEVNPFSNYLLGYVRDLKWHPAKQLINHGVPFTLNSDDNMLWDVEVGSFDFMLAALYWDFDLRDLKWCILNSFKYASIDAGRVQKAREVFETNWNMFIEHMNA